MWGSGTVLFLDLSDVFMGISLGRNLWDVHFCFVGFSVKPFIFHKW